MICVADNAEAMWLCCDFPGCRQTLTEPWDPQRPCESLSDMAWSHEWLGADPSDLLADVTRPVAQRRKTYCASHSTRCFMCEAEDACIECDGLGYFPAFFEPGQAVVALDGRIPDFVTVVASAADRYYKVESASGTRRQVAAHDLTPAPKHVSADDALYNWLGRNSHRSLL